MKWKDLIRHSEVGCQPPLTNLISDYRELLEIREALKNISMSHRNKLRDNNEKEMEQKAKEIKDYLREHIINIIVEDVFSDLFWGEET